MRSRAVSLLVCLLLLGGACSGGEEGAPSAASSPDVSTSEKDSKKPKADKPGGTKKKRSGQREQNGSGAPAETESGSDPQEPPGAEEGDGGGDLATAAATVRDTGADAEVHGEAPGYAEITGASIQGRGRTVRLEVTLADAIPATLEEDAFMVVEIRIEHERREYSVYANGTEQGWEGFVSDGSKSRRARGFRIDGRTIIWEPTWSQIGGASRFTWYGGFSWTRPTLTRTHYAFDAAPNDYRARFPSN